MEGVTNAPMRALLSEVGGFTFCVTEYLRVSQSVPGVGVFRAHVPELADGGRTPAGLPVQVQLLGGDPAAGAGGPGRGPGRGPRRGPQLRLSRRRRSTATTAVPCCSSNPGAPRHRGGRACGLAEGNSRQRQAAAGLGRSGASMPMPRLRPRAARPGLPFTAEPASRAIGRRRTGRRLARAGPTGNRRGGQRRRLESRRPAPLSRRERLPSFHARPRGAGGADAGPAGGV